MSEAPRLPPEHPNGIRRVSVGCGPHHHRAGWWNTDLRKFPGIDEALDATAEWRWNDLLDFVFAEHFLEHLECVQAVKFLANAGNALRVGGRIRLSTPSLEWVLTTHYSFFAEDNPLQIDQTLNINRAFHGWGHKFLFSKGMLKWLLEGLGYIDVKFYDYNQSECQDLRGLELHGGWQRVNGYPSVWIVEAQKGEKGVELKPELIAKIEKDFARHVSAGH